MLTELVSLSLSITISLIPVRSVRKHIYVLDPHSLNAFTSFFHSVLTYEANKKINKYLRFTYVKRLSIEILLILSIEQFFVVVIRWVCFFQHLSRHWIHFCRHTFRKLNEQRKKSPDFNCKFQWFLIIFIARACMCVCV